MNKTITITIADEPKISLKTSYNVVAADIIMASLYLTSLTVQDIIDLLNIEAKTDGVNSYLERMKEEAETFQPLIGQ